MSIKKVTYYQPVCDSCGSAEADSEYSAWSEPTMAHDIAVNNDWYEVDDQLLLCPNCQVCDVCGDKATRIGAGHGFRNIPVCEDHTPPHDPSGLRVSPVDTEKGNTDAR